MARRVEFDPSMISWVADVPSGYAAGDRGCQPGAKAAQIHYRSGPGHKVSEIVL